MATYRVTITKEVLPGTNPVRLVLPDGTSHPFVRDAPKGGRAILSHDLELEPEDAAQLQADGYSLKKLKK